ncbi:MAG: S8 family serine peptidase, partial [Planctomycetota bacterium]
MRHRASRCRDRSNNSPASRVFRRVTKRRRLFETLESRRLLSADSGSLTPPLLIGEDSFADDSILVRYHSGMPASVLNDFGADRVFDSVPGLLQLPTPTGLDALESVAFYANHPGVIYAEPNYSVSLMQTPNDADYADLWGMNNSGQTGGTADADIDAEEAWEVTTGSRDTIVAVVDTGVDYLHPDLAANMWVNPGEIAGDGIDNDGNGFVDDVHGYNFVSRNGNPMDDHDHGTHVAGTIGAVANNGIGVAGVSWDVQIMAVKFLDARGGGSTANAVAAIEYAVDNGAVLSNHSWGFNGGYSQALADAIEYARLADHLVVAAAGNGGGDRIGDDNDSVPFYPGNFPHENLISIAATDHNDDLATFSNYGRTQVDLGAPGVAILSTTRGGTYETFSGTSMATPHAAGVAALLRSEYPDWTFDKVRDRLFDTVDPLASLDSITTTGGRLNAARAVEVDLVGPVIANHSPIG